MKENNIPVDARGRPELSGYTDSAAYYAAMHDQGLRAMEFARRVHGTWGLIAKGAESIPYALAMLRSKDSDAREDGAAVLGEIGKNSDVIEELLSALPSEVDTQARDSIILALGRMKNRAAIPALAALIEDERTNGDTRWTAVESLGRIVRKRFLAQPEPVAAAVTWLKRLLLEHERIQRRDAPRTFFSLVQRRSMARAEQCRGPVRWQRTGTAGRLKPRHSPHTTASRGAAT